MITTADIGDALTKCTGYDPTRFPKPSQIMVQAWLEHFDQFPHLTRDDVREAVRVYHREPHDRTVQPADISKIARAIHQDRSDRSPLCRSCSKVATSAGFCEEHYRTPVESDSAYPPPEEQKLINQHGTEKVRVALAEADQKRAARGEPPSTSAKPWWS